jgi:hypothetical protein
MDFKNLPPRQLSISPEESEFDFTPEEWGQIAFLMLALSRTAFRILRSLCAQDPEFDAAHLAASVAEREEVHRLIRDRLFFEEFVPTYELSLLSDNLRYSDKNRTLHWLRKIVRRSGISQSTSGNALLAAFGALSRNEIWRAAPGERKPAFAVQFRRDMKRLLLLYGSDRGEEKGLGYADQDRALIDLRAASRLERGRSWKRGEATPLYSPRESEDDDSRDRLEFEIAMSAAEIDSDTSLVDMAEALSEFEREKATEGERALLDALRHTGAVLDALAAVGDPSNWSRWQSLQRRVRRHRTTREKS